MPIVQKVQDTEYAGAFAQVLTEILPDTDLDGLARDEDGNTPEVNTVETYSEALMLTRDAGLVAYLSDGAEVHLTVQVYRPRKDGD